ncbi:MAG: hypothetical protein LBS88_12840 [Tannerellaceae bacterium]|nr:hypothetical protein [Tannerellaceae bacterium]
MDRGLYFHAFRANKDNRTSLNLTPDKPLSLSGGFTLTFDFRIRAETEIFGYILRIIGNESNNIDLISNTYLYNNIILVAGDHTLMDFNLDELPENPIGKWVEASLTFDAAYSRIEFTLCGIRKSAEYDVRGLNRAHICFGGNSHPDFMTTDVAPFILRDVKIFDGKKRLLRYWKLDKHGNGVVWDECEKARATIAHAKWEIDNHAQWEKQATLTVTGRYPKIAFDRKRKRIFILERARLYVYDTTGRNITDTIAFRQGIPFNVEPNQFFYNETNDELIMYDFEKNKPGHFNFALREWDNNDNRLTFSRYRHHNKYYDEENKVIYTLGGYGFHQYSALLQAYSDSLQQWESTDLSGLIHPRYLASMGVWNDSLLLYFGGYGNASGKQYESPHNYYDLYALNPRTRNVRKLWELNNTGAHFTNSNSLIVNQADQIFYTLSYPNNVYETEAFLHEYSLHTPGYRKLANPLPFFFNDEESNCDLFMPADSSALFAILSYTTGSDSRIDIYSIAYPPLGMFDILQAENHSAAVVRTLFPYLIASFALFSLLIFAVVKRKKKTVDIHAVHSLPKATASETEAGYPPGHKANQTITCPAINVLSRFEVLDSDGTDITHLFTLTGTRIFLLIYFRTICDGKGITSYELQKTLWPDKDYESAQNNRNVYFNKLRTILNMMGDVRLNKTNEFWTLSYDNKKMYSDYEQIIRNVNLIREQSVLNKNLLRDTLCITRKGKLLPFHETEWLDNYKASYANMIIEFLWKLTEHPDVRNDYPLLLNMAEVILIQDSLEESGIRLKCRSLFKLGKKKQALLCYHKYAEEYFAILSIRPDLSFDEIVN